MNLKSEKRGVFLSFEDFFRSQKYPWSSREVIFSRVEKNFKYVSHRKEKTLSGCYRCGRRLPIELCTKENYHVCQECNDHMSSDFNKKRLFEKKEIINEGDFLL